ncbi:MAG: MBL fold metallo-hydrolase [Thermodesulfobacteriota bacterium]|nr:MBL fold metallo-hydrolase [Thermodesulfobacteriota bacterium]
MEVCFWGTRGSLPASVNTDNIQRKLSSALEVAVEKGLGSGIDIEAFITEELPFWVRGTYGTNTSCVEIRDGDDFVLCDAGTGLRDFGNYLQTHADLPPKDFHIFISHMHWDHIQGFPFFVPAYVRGNRVTFYGCHEEMKEAFKVQQSHPFFPFRFEDLGAEIHFVHITAEKAYDVAGFKVTPKQQNHPGKSYGYRFVREGKTVVYSTDCEHKFQSDEDTAPVVEFFDEADLLIFDAQYTFVDACTIKEDWGHSNNLIGMELAQKAGVKHLCLYHHEPASSDEDLDKLLRNTKKLAALLEEGGALKVSMAWDRMRIQV